MRIMTLSAAIVLALAAVSPGSAQAKGCIKGAVVGGVAGHMAHHGVLGAAGGCAVGHHMASEKEKRAEQQQMQTQRLQSQPRDGTDTYR
ncbi:MAG: hypothetical protein QOG25_2910 [Acetobacteraceae bacterium]|jgi:hypothetical protein|nr:hypothetical protein [Acetobacteraceae bacterium]